MTMEFGGLIRSESTHRPYVLLRKPFLFLRLVPRLLMIPVFAVLAGCGPTSYSADEWSARVVDRDTGAPIGGAVVLVIWDIESYSGELAYPPIDASDTYTDASGTFRFPAWGPRPAPSWDGRPTRINPNQPTIRIFKSGYWIKVDVCGDQLGYLRPLDGYGPGPKERRACMTGRTYELEPFKEGRAAYMSYLNDSFPLRVDDCGYERFPRIFAAAISEYQRFLPESELQMPHLAPEILEQFALLPCKAPLMQVIGRYLQ